MLEMFDIIKKIETMKKIEREIGEFLYFNGNIIVDNDWIPQFLEIIGEREVLEIRADSSLISNELRKLNVPVSGTYLGDKISAALYGHGKVSLYAEGDTNFTGKRFYEENLLREKNERVIVTHLIPLDKEEERSGRLQDLDLLNLLRESRKTNSELAVFLRIKDLKYLPRFFAAAQEEEDEIKFINLPEWQNSKNLLLIVK